MEKNLHNWGEKRTSKDFKVKSYVENIWTQIYIRNDASQSWQHDRRTLLKKKKTSDQFKVCVFILWCAILLSIC